MTALTKFDRLEATALWRPSPNEQRRDVVVSLGDATLTVNDSNNTPLTHWSLGAIKRANGTAVPAIYHPDGDPEETIELGPEEAEMIAGLDRVIKAIDRRRPRPGKLRLLLSASIALAIGLAAYTWLPDALERYTVTVVPPVKRTEIGERLLGHITRLTGPPCSSDEARRPLERLSKRILGPERGDSLVILPAGTLDSAHLPGGFVLLNRAVVEVHEDPDVAAGYILVEMVRSHTTDPLADLIDFAGLNASLKLITTGTMPDASLKRYAEHIMTRPKSDPSASDLLFAFEQADLRSSPYAYAKDITGDSVQQLIANDPRIGQPSRQVLSDGDWVRLQGICGS